METYDPNIKWVKQKVEIKLQQWNHTATLHAEVGGNCFGFDILETAINIAYEKLLPEDDSSLASVILIDPEGGRLLCEDDENREEDWLKDMVVGVRIVEQPAPNPKGAS